MKYYYDYDCTLSFTHLSDILYTIYKYVTIKKKLRSHNCKIKENKYSNIQKLIFRNIVVCQVWLYCIIQNKNIQFPLYVDLYPFDVAHILNSIH